jgi:excisionase family DNA binding protein
VLKITGRALFGLCRDLITENAGYLIQARAKGPNMSKRLLSTSEAADYLGVSPNTIRNYIERGLIASHRTGPRPLLKFDPADLDELAPKDKGELT